MQREIINPANEAAWLELRKNDITSTEIGALFGLADSTYIPTKYELWHRKKKELETEFEPTDRIKWGKRLEASIAEGISQDQGWKVRPMTEYIRIPELRLGASFDYSIDAVEKMHVDKAEWRILEETKAGHLEIKNVDGLIFRDKWIVNDDDTIEAPPAIELQIQHQMLVSGRTFAVLAALIGGNRVVLVRREADADIHAAIIDQAKAFWASIDANVEPAPDFVRDSKTISKLYGYAEPGKVLDARGNAVLSTLAKRHKALGDEAKRIEDERQGIKSQIILMIGDVEKVEADGFTISCGMIGPSTYTVNRDGYRNFRPNWPRTKK